MGARTVIIPPLPVATAMLSLPIFIVFVLTQGKRRSFEFKKINQEVMLTNVTIYIAIN